MINVAAPSQRRLGTILFLLASWSRGLRNDNSSLASSRQTCYKFPSRKNHAREESPSPAADPRLANCCSRGPLEVVVIPQSGLARICS